MSAPWDQVAAAGTDPAVLAAVVALATTADGRAGVRAALDRPVGGLLGADDTVIEALLPVPTSHQRHDAAAACRVWVDMGVRAALRGDPAWPDRLARVAAPPLLLAWRGPAMLPARPSVAIVGARRATAYGTGVAAWLAESAAAAGATVVSGGALGIDAAAHGAAAAAGSVVVLGCGHDVEYPRPHARTGGLFDRILTGGGAIVSELLPGTQPRPHLVRARNRIVAGLVDVVVVVEGRERSGALVTAGEAADAGVEVMAVPGDVRAPGSAAPHRLLAEGAGICTSPEDLLAALTLSAASDDATMRPATVLPAAIHRVLAERWPRPVRTTDLATLSSLSVAQVLAAVTRGRVAGEVAEGPDGVRLRRAPRT